MGMPVITPSTTTREQAITDIIESVALEETALSHILNAEGEKIQKMVAMPDITPEMLLATNKSVESISWLGDDDNLQARTREALDVQTGSALSVRSGNSPALTGRNITRRGFFSKAPSCSCIREPALGPAHRMDCLSASP